mmetsp:Transcript_5822/g.10387  ORF Transcript_5822/g.10387 Transcript_5822/m.10387 type:complete len:445 (-) Transcript_5822:32-1366(-)
MPEVISIHLGQTGVQVGNSCWQLFCLEHGITPDGLLSSGFSAGGETSFGNFFNETPEGKHVPRSVFVDSDPDTIDELRTGSSRQLFKPEQLISGKESASNNYARGYYTVSKEILDPSLECIRRIADSCVNLEGFHVYYAVGGGTGSGFGALLLEKLSEEYPKKLKLGFTVFPRPQTSTVVVEPYNAILSAHSLLENIDSSVILGNDAIFDISRHKLNIKSPSYSNLNHLVAQVVSSLTASFRFESSFNAGLTEFQSNLVPFPRYCFLLSSYSPFIPAGRVLHVDPSASELAINAFDPSNMMAKCNPGQGKYFSICLTYRGDVVPTQVSSAAVSLSTMKTIQFADWRPNYKVGITHQTPEALPGSGLAKVVRDACMVSNSSAISEVISGIAYKFDRMFANRSYVHAYCCTESLEEGTFIEARENLEGLEREYEEISSEVGQRAEK